MKIAVARNRKNKGVICQFGRPSPEVYGRKSVQRVMDGLRAAGHEVKVLEADSTLLAKLAQFMPPDPAGNPTGLVFNMAYGIQGECRYTHLPSILEMAGIPYTGSSPLGHTLSLDKVVTKKLLRCAGVPTPDWVVMTRPERDLARLKFPLIVKPIHESTSYGVRLVHDGQELAEAVETVLDNYEQPALVETYIDGREINIALLGNDPPEILSPVELDFGSRALRIDTQKDKFHLAIDEPEKRCPADLTETCLTALRKIARDTFHAVQCRDYARIDLRLDKDGNPWVLEINSMASLGEGGSYVLAAQENELNFDALVCRIVDVAHLRYYGIPAPRCFNPLPEISHLDVSTNSEQEMPTTIIKTMNASGEV